MAGFFKKVQRAYRAYKEAEGLPLYQRIPRADENYQIASADADIRSGKTGGDVALKNLSSLNKYKGPENYELFFKTLDGLLTERKLGFYAKQTAIQAIADTSHRHYDLTARGIDRLEAYVDEKIIEDSPGMEQVVEAMFSVCYRKWSDQTYCDSSQAPRILAFFDKLARIPQPPERFDSVIGAGISGAFRVAQANPGQDVAVFDMLESFLRDRVLNEKNEKTAVECLVGLVPGQQDPAAFIQKIDSLIRDNILREGSVETAVAGLAKTGAVDTLSTMIRDGLIKGDAQNHTVSLLGTHAKSTHNNVRSTSIIHAFRDLIVDDKLEPDAKNIAIGQMYDFGPARDVLKSLLRADKLEGGDLSLVLRSIRGRPSVPDPGTLRGIFEIYASLPRKNDPTVQGPYAEIAVQMIKRIADPDEVTRVITHGKTAEHRSLRELFALADATPELLPPVKDVGTFTDMFNTIFNEHRLQRDYLDRTEALEAKPQPAVLAQ